MIILFSIGVSANEIFACEVTTRFVNSLVGALAVSVGKVNKSSLLSPFLKCFLAKTRIPLIYAI